MNPKKILLTVNILLSGLILWAGSNIVMTWTDREGGAGPPEERIPREETKHGQPLGAVKRMSDYQAIISQDIFRSTRERPGGAVQVRREEEEKIEPTRLNLKLKGVVVTGTTRALAVILDGATRREDIYYLNDTVQNAKIVKILHDQVILSVNDRQEALLLFADGEQSERGRTARPGSSPSVHSPVTGPGDPSVFRAPAWPLPVR